MHQYQEFCLNVSSSLEFNSIEHNSVSSFGLAKTFSSLSQELGKNRTTEQNACQPQGCMSTKTAGKARLVSARTSLVAVTCLRVSSGEVSLSTASHWQLETGT